jgi:hypothetical protein
MFAAALGKTALDYSLDISASANAAGGDGGD